MTTFWKILTSVAGSVAVLGLVGALNVWRDAAIMERRLQTLEAPNFLVKVAQAEEKLKTVEQLEERANENAKKLERLDERVKGIEKTVDKVDEKTDELLRRLPPVPRNSETKAPVEDVG